MIIVEVPLAAFLNQASSCACTENNVQHDKPILIIINLISWVIDAPRNVIMVINCHWPACRIFYGRLNYPQA